MAKKIKLIKPTDTTSLTYTCPPGYAARLELVGGYIQSGSTIQIIDLATNLSVWSLYLETFAINSDAPLLGERYTYSSGSSMISIPPEYIAYYATQVGSSTPIQGFRKIWYLDGGAVGEKFTISSPNGLTARILVIEEEHNNPAASISSVSSTSVNGTAGAYVYFNVVSSNFSDGSTLYWTINHNAGSPYQSYQTNNDDFLATNGSFTINNNAGSFMIQVKPAIYPYNEWQEYFKVAIRQNSITGDILGLSPVITISATIYSD